MTTKVTPGICGICSSGCGVNIYLENDKLTRISPLEGHPLGSICPRGVAAPEILYSPDRLLYPQGRVGERGAGQFERISWDTAYTRIVASLREIASKYGPQAVCTYTGRGNFEFGLNEHFAPTGPSETSANAVLFPFGSPNTAGVGSLCYVSYGMVATRSLFGEDMRNLREDVNLADLILIWGANPSTDSPPSMYKRVKSAQLRGARVVVIDHRRSETARALPCEWVGVRPGTDGALALAILHVLIDENLYDHSFVENWTHGFDELRAYVREFSPEYAASITWVPAEKIRELAHAIASAKRFSILTYTGLEYSNTGLQAIRAIWIIQAITGHLDSSGGKLFKMKDRIQTQRWTTDPPAGAPLPVGAREYPIYYEVRKEAHGALLPKAILEGQPYPIRALIVSGTSLITSWPDPTVWHKALAALDLLVVINRFPTADSAYADLVLPASTLFEIESYMAYDNYIQLRSPIIAPLGESRSDYKIFSELASRLGYGHLWPQSEEEMVRHALQGTGVSLEELRQHPEGIALPEPNVRYRKYASGELRSDGQPGFETPTGKFEITSEWLRGHGYDALPVYTEPIEGPLQSPEVAKRYPLVFNSGARTLHPFRSQYFNIPSLVSKQPHPLVNIHPQDAALRGIADGDDVNLETPRGSLVFRARVTEDILPGVIEANMGGGGPFGSKAWQESNVNVLTDFNNREEILGFPVYKALLCEVSKKV